MHLSRKSKYALDGGHFVLTERLTTSDTMGQNDKIQINLWITCSLSFSPHFPPKITQCSNFGNILQFKTLGYFTRVEKFEDVLKFWGFPMQCALIKLVTTYSTNTAYRATEDFWQITPDLHFAIIFVFFRWCKVEEDAHTLWIAWKFQRLPLKLFSWKCRLALFPPGVKAFGVQPWNQTYECDLRQYKKC